MQRPIDLFIQPLLQQKPRLIQIVIALAILSISQALFLILIKGFMEALFGQGSSDQIVNISSLLPKDVLRFFPSAESISVTRSQLTIGVPLCLFLAAITKAVATYIYQLGQQALALFIAKTYRDRLFSALLSLPYIEIKRSSAGDWMSVIMNDVMFLQMRFSDFMTSFVKDSVLIFSCFIALSFIHWPSALILAIFSPVIAFGMGQIGRRIAVFAERFQRELAKLSAATLDVRSRFDFIRAQAGERLEEKRFNTLNFNYYRIIRRSILIRSSFAPMLEFLGFSVFAGFVYAIGKGYWGSNFTPAFMMQFFVALGLLLKPLRNIGEQISRFQETRGSLAKSLSVFTKLEQLADKSVDTAEPLAEIPNIEIKKLNAGFDKSALQCSGISIKPGTSVAIIGPSGAGKSTLLRTFGGLIRPFEWDGSISWNSLRSLTSMVSQEPFLFDDKISTNLQYGLEEKSCDDSIWETLSLVNIADEVKSLNEGIETRIRAIGSNFSGGQLQRLVIARALLRDRPLWLFDEATSAIDAKSERDITIRLIDECHKKNRSLLMVTHRLQWLDKFDEVWFMENGEIKQTDTHETLLKNARYAEFYASSSGGQR